MSKDGKDVRISSVFDYNGNSERLNSDSFEQLERNAAESPCKEIVTEVFRHKESGVEWKITRTRYKDFYAEEFSGEIFAPKNTKAFSNIMWEVAVAGQMGKLIGNYGDGANGFAEYEEELGKKPIEHIANDGRPTHEYFPYYRIETDEVKTFAVLGWLGSWETRFVQERDKAKMLAGQHGVNICFNEQERFILPSVLILRYDSNSVNVWRKFYIKHIMPKVNGKKLLPKLGVFNGVCEGLTEERVRNFRSEYESHGVDYDFWWFDAGWGTDGTGSHNKSGKWEHGVNFEMNRDAFPDGLKEFGKSLKENGKDFMLWFEPELIRTPPELWSGYLVAHPDFKTEWLVGTYSYEWCGTVLTARMLDMGNDECRAWLERRVFEVLDESGANIYRQDFNIPPCSVWENADVPERTGITENKYCAGLLKFYGDIRSRYGEILMDSCASGGGRCDLETMKLMVPLHYSDNQDVHPEDFNAHIYMQQIFWRWFPYTKNWLSPSALQTDYGARSVMNACVVAASPNFPESERYFERIKSVICEWREIADGYFGNYYELEKPTRDDEHIKAFQFFAPENGKGFAMVFVPEKCDKNEYAVMLRGLEKEKTYVVTVKDEGTIIAEKGVRLCERGIRIKTSPFSSHLLIISEKD